MTPGSYFADYLHEIVLFSRYLSLPEIQLVESYLKAKWGTP